ncbi:putative ribonuclease H-like domain-containing protein, partial [Tanacetum coccineum]
MRQYFAIMDHILWDYIPMEGQAHNVLPSSRFHDAEDAKTLWSAIKARFGGNEASKKMQKNLLKQQFETFTIGSREELDSAYERFPNILLPPMIRGQPGLDDWRVLPDPENIPKASATTQMMKTAEIDEDAMEEKTFDGRYPHQKKSFIPSAVLTREGLKRDMSTQAVLSQSTGRPYYPRMDNIRPRTSSFSPSTRSSTTRTPHRPQRPKKIMKSIWLERNYVGNHKPVLHIMAIQKKILKAYAIIDSGLLWKVTRKVQDCLHVDFLEDQENQKGKGGKVSTYDDVEDLDDQQFIVHGPSIKHSEERTADKEVPLSSGEQALHDELVSLMHQESIAKVICAQRKTKALDEEKRRIAPENGKNKEPKKVSQALADESWVEAMQEELLQFKLQDVWVLCDLPDGKRVIGTKWVFRNKRDERGTIIKNKARLVAQGYRQEEGVDYDEVFAPVARIEAIRLFLAFASFMGFTVYQMDVKSAFLYGNITEEVYVKQPPGFEDPAHPNKVYRVVKALYGLHQAPRAWYERLSTFLLKHGYRRGAIDKTLFIKKDRRDIMLVQVYVDDIIFGSTKPSMVKDFEELMQKEFKMSSMGELTFFLGLQVKQTTAGIFLSQDKYVKDILNKFDFRTIKPASTPIEAHKSLGKDEEGEDVDVHLYRSMIGCLMYLTASRPDIMFAVCLCARFQVTPKVSHMHAVKRIFRYLKHQPKLGLWYPKDSPFHLEAFSDSDYAGDNHDRRSTSGGCQYLGRRLVSWQCKKQTIVAISSTEAKYVAAASCCAQVLWMQNQLLDYGFNFMNTEIHIDNESTICIVKNPVLHSKTKHIQIRHHFIRDCYEQRLINVVKATTSLRVINEVPHIRAMVAGKRVLISEETIRADLLFDDADGVDCFPKQVIWDSLRDIGYEGNLAQLTFSKPLFSPQWKYLVHVLLHCLSPKSTSWEQFGTNIASALVGLATNQKFNFSLMIMNGMLGHIANGKPFLMYPRFIQLFLNKQLEGVTRPQNFIPSVTLPSKVFTFMRKHSPNFSGRITPLTPHMLEVITALAAEEAHSESTHSRAENSPRDAQGTPPQGTAKAQGTADFQDESQTSGGDEGLLDLYALNREVRRLKKQTISQAKQIHKLMAKLKKLSKGVKPLVKHHILWVKSQTLKKRGKKKKKKVSSVKLGRNKDEENLSKEHHDQDDHNHTTFVYGDQDEERKSDETEQMIIEEEKDTSDVKSGDTEELDLERIQSTSDVKSGDTEELDLERIQSTARQSAVTPRTLNFEDEACPSSPIRPTQEEEFKDDEFLADISLNISRPRGLSIPGP